MHGSLRHSQAPQFGSNGRTAAPLAWSFAVVGGLRLDGGGSGGGVAPGRACLPLRARLYVRLVRLAGRRVLSKKDVT